MDLLTTHHWSVGSGNSAPHRERETVSGGPVCRVLKGVFRGKPKDSVWEDWGTLGKIKEITTAPEESY